MSSIAINAKAIKATKWSAITEISTKLVSPIINMILARLLVPEAFGVIVTINMIISFAIIFSDAGFQKYLIQKEFIDLKEKYEYTTVAFWTNLSLSLFLWGVIAFFSDSIGTLVGSPGMGFLIIIACAQLPLIALSSIQMSLYRREFDFKTLFIVRIITAFIPVVITIPLAFLGFSYWSLIIGTLVTQFASAIILTIKSKWKPNFFYSFEMLYKMFSFSMWSLIEAFAIWLTAWIDIFIIGNMLNEYYVGLYKTSLLMVTALLSIITAAIIPVLFSTLSRLQADDKAFKKFFYDMQRGVAYLVLPMGFGVFLYSDLATLIILGDKWMEASNIIGIWALTSSIVIITSHFSSEVYRAKGQPKLSFFTQMIHLSFLIPTLLISINYGFWALVYSRALVRFQGVITGFIVMRYFFGFLIKETLFNLKKPIIFTTVICLFAFASKQISNTIIWELVTIGISIVLYSCMFIIFSRNDFKVMKKNFKRG